mmetsp:Transcript_477/g.805  ORF Transcript_477/g.805 Transcript_477/m.805 type:complete len:1104 (-) Transcript_477:54-3365(-)
MKDHSSNIATRIPTNGNERNIFHSYDQEIPSPMHHIITDDQDSTAVRNWGSPPTSPPSHSVLRGIQSPPPLIPSLMESVAPRDNRVIAQDANFGYENSHNGCGFNHANSTDGIFSHGQCLQPRDITDPLWNTLGFCPDEVGNDDCEHNTKNCRGGYGSKLNEIITTTSTSATGADTNSISRGTVNGLEYSKQLNILSLPLDSLHMIASFLEVKEWKTFGVASRDASLACRDVFRKVKMHAFYCAVEVVTAWNRGEHADAKELAALYIQSGIPIYPSPLGHSYHTVHWRMKVESDAMKRQNDENGDNISSHDDRDSIVGGSDMNSNTFLSAKTLFETRNGQLDRFYIERNDTRTLGGHYLPSLTYVEEKGLYWSSKNKGIPVGQLTLQERHEYSQRFHVRLQSPFPARGFSFLGFYDDDHQDDNLSDNADQRQRRDNEVVGLEGGDASVSARRLVDNCRYSLINQKIQSSHNEAQKETLNKPKLIIYCHKHLIDRHLQGRASIVDEHGDMHSPPMSLSADFFHPTNSRCHSQGHAIYQPQSSRVIKSLERPPSRQQERVDSGSTPSNDRIVCIPVVNEFVEHSIMSEIELCSYDSKSGEASKIWGQIAVYQNLKPSNFVPLRTANEMTHIIASFQRKLMSLLQRGDFAACDDCMLDFWDEFFPRTNTVSYFDRHTPVPRMSKLHTFLTRPCPKAFGTMQCEIERIRVRYRTKGMVTGRYYTTYEYRLFIRDRRKLINEVNQRHESCSPRMDTILMTAKYRGKYYSGSNGPTQFTQCKKGANQYCVFLPQQSDIDEHFEHVNEKINLNSFSAGKQAVPASGSTLELCRIQANCMGTEFQITAPLLLNDTKKDKSDIVSSTDSNPGGHGECSTKKKTSHPLLIFRNKNLDDKINNNAKRQGSNRSSRIAARITPFSLKKHESCASLEPKPSDSGIVYPSHVGEKEIAAITYTANVLGNRPRIMNVAIPKLSCDADMPETTWLKTSGDEGRILNYLKALHQRSHENDEGNSELAPVHGEDGLISLQNRPPWWNVELGAFVLNFGGRVSVASVKNFQLCERRDHNNIMLQFGRIEGRHSFTMDFSYPLSPVQAFAISISSLQSKISFA